MLALLYDIHGNLPALDAVLDDARGRGARTWLIGGDVSAFGGWPAETVQRLRGLERATWIRGNWERWVADRAAMPARDPLPAVADAVRDALGEDLVAELAALPESVALDGSPAGPTRAWHGSPAGDVVSFLPTPGPDERTLLQGVTERRLIFGHTHLQFRRIAVRGDEPPVELVNPGSVGLPFDGDRRAAYALLDPDGRIDLHRIPYDHDAAVAGVRAVAGGALWAESVARSLQAARFPA